MSESEKYCKLLPVDDNVVVKLAEPTKFYVCGTPVFDATQFLYTSTKQIVAPVEFVPDQPEIIEASTQKTFESPLDDIRKTMK